MSERPPASDQSQQQRSIKRERFIARAAIVLFFATKGPLLGLISFIIGFFTIKLLINPNIQHDEFFSSESIALVYVVGVIPALIVGMSACRTAEANGGFSLKRTVISATIIGVLLSSPFLWFGYDTPPHTISERLPAAAMILWVNLGAATLSWVLWELLRRGAVMASKRREA